MNSQTYLKWGGCNQATAPLLMKKAFCYNKKVQMGILENKKDIR